MFGVVECLRCGTVWYRNWNETWSWTEEGVLDRSDATWHCCGLLDGTFTVYERPKLGLELHTIVKG